MEVNRFVITWLPDLLKKYFRVLNNIDENLICFPERRVSASSLDPRVKELTDENEKIHKQNNLLTLKVELLLDMLAQKTAEADILTKDMEKMKAILLAVHPTRKQ